MLSISPSAVDQRLERARNILGAASRAEAVRLYKATCRETTCGPQDIAAAPAPVPSNSSTAEGEGITFPLREMRTPFDHTHRPAWKEMLQLLRRVEARDLSVTIKLALATACALALVMLAGGLSLFLYGFLAIGRTLLG